MNETVILPGIYAFIVAVIALLIRYRSKDGNKQYDEMQLRTRAEAYKIAFFTVLILLVGIIFYDVAARKPLPQYMLGGILIVVVMISFLVFAVYSIWHDAFFYIGQSWKSYFGVCIGVGLIQMISFISTVARYFDGREHEENFWNLLISKTATSATMTITFLTLAVVIFIKQRKENRISED